MGLTFNTKNPGEGRAYQWFKRLGSTGVKRYLGISTYAELESAAAEAVCKPGQYIKLRLQRGEDNKLTRAETLAFIRSDQRSIDITKRPVVAFSRAGLAIEDSPRKVRKLLTQYAADAKRLLDPFAGTGNVPIVAGQLGIEAFYCEIDPLYRFVTDTKIRLLTLNDSAKQRVLDRLKSDRIKFRKVLDETSPAADLAMRDYTRGDEQDEGLEELARAARTVVDVVAEEDPLYAQILAVVYIDSVKRVVSEGVQAQDQEALLIDRVTSAARDEFDSISGWLREAQPLLRIPHLIAADARDLSDIVDLGIDCVMTNPPQLGAEDDEPSDFARWFLRLPGSLDQEPAAERIAGSTTHRQTRNLIKTNLASINSMFCNAGGSGHDYLRAVEGVEDVVKAVGDGPDRGADLKASEFFLLIAKVFREAAAQSSDRARFLLEVADTGFGGVTVATAAIMTSVLRLFGFTSHQGLLIGEDPDRHSTRRVLVYERTSHVPRVKSTSRNRQR